MPYKNPDHWTAEVVYWPYPRPAVLTTADIHVEVVQGPLRALEAHFREHQRTIRKVTLEPPGTEDPAMQMYVDKLLEEPVQVTVPTLVVAPTNQLFETWLKSDPSLDPHLVEYVGRYEQIAGNFRPIIVLNGGSHDPHIKALVQHPSRRGLVTHVTV